MDRNVMRLRLLAIPLAIVFTFAAYDVARSDDTAPPAAAGDTAVEAKQLAEDIRQLREAIRELHDAIKRPSVARQEEKPAPDDTPVVKFFKLQVADVDEVSGLLELLPDVSFKVIGADKRLAVVAPAGQMQAVAEVIAEADRLPQQVQVSAFLYEVPVEAVDQLEQRATNGGSQAGPWGALTFFTTNDVSEMIHALEAVEGARLLARPTIVTWDKEEATFQSVQEIPVQKLIPNRAGGNIGITQFEEVGIKLQVKPTVGDGIVLDLHPEYSVLKGFQNGQPMIDRRSAVSRIRLTAGAATLVRGLLGRNETENGEIAKTEFVAVLRAEVVDRARLAAAKQDAR